MLKIAVIDNSIFDTNRIIQILKQIQSNTEIQSYNSITSFLTSNALFKELVDSPQKRTEKTEEVSMIYL